jgi:mannonate dehydratase
MDVNIILPPSPDERWTFAKQMGIDTAVVRFWGVEEPWWTEETLGATYERFADHGISLDVVEDRPPMEKTVLGRDGRDEEIAEVKRLLRNMGDLGIEVYSWVWTEHPLGVIRTSKAIEDRGGSLQSGYDHAWMQRRGDYPAADLTEEEAWENLQYFLDEVVPVAEEAGVKMALHPDDPPISPVRGMPRIVSSVENYERILEMYPSPNHGLTFCQGNFTAMGADIPSAIRRFEDKIHFVHFRDVAGTAESFVETWHDDGPTDMQAAMDAYREIGFDGPIRPDHVAKMVDEEDSDEAMAGYTTLGRLFAVGYMKGLLDREPV